MSLNGLDSPQLIEAFEKACLEPGGWFWIKYASRDDVEFLCKGSNGSEEMREAAANEPGDSPLYGFIRFRRRNILIKYIPEGTSRVLKARSKVHFQSVAERFNPHDTEISISSPKELRDHALTPACPTHTATASVSSSNSSLRQRRLTDIAESADEEEPLQTTISTESAIPLGEENLKGSRGLAVVVTTHDPKIADGGPGSPVFLEDGDHLASPRGSIFADLREPRRKSTNSMRPTPTDIYGYPLAPKVRLGPRPHVESLKRPHTSSERSKAFPSPGEEIRPVASVPKSVQIAPRKSSASSVRTKSLTSESVKSLPVSLPPSVPQAPLSPVTPSPPSPIYSPLPPPQPEGPPVLSPEKQRLMKALQLRRKTMMPDLKEQATVDGNLSLPVNIKEQVTTDEEVPSPVNIKEQVTTDEEVPSPVDVKEQDEAKSMDSEAEEDPVPEPTPELDSTRDENLVESPDQIDKGAEMEIEEESNDPGEKMMEDSRQTETGGRKEEDASPESPPAGAREQHDGGTKVRGEPESDIDTESDQSIEVVIAESRPVSVKPVQQPIPNIVKSIFHTAQPNKPLSPVVPHQVPGPKVLKRAERPGTLPPSEVPVIETARSVSAPFLKSAREANKQPAVVRKVNVGGGSVLQRIRQLEMLSVGESQPATPPISPPRSRNVSPTPTSVSPFGPSRSPSVHGNSPIRKLSNPPPPPTRSSSSPNTSPSHGRTAVVFQQAPPLPPLPQSQTQPGPCSPKSAPIPPPAKHNPPKMEIIERNNRPELQVTTTIPRDENLVSPSSESSGKAAGALQVPSPSFFETGNIASVLDRSPTRRASIDVASLPLSTLSRRQSTDRAIPLRSSSSRDLGDLPENRPSTTSSKRSKSGKDRRGSSSSSSTSSQRSHKSPTTPKSPKSPKGFLRRMSSSLSKKSKEVVVEAVPAPALTPEPAEPLPKVYLLAGWINVQLPDTMLWRRRCMKIDSNRWLFLSLTDDENSPQTRKYHIPSEVRSVDLPDVDEQELPHSVRLFLEEGGTLQCACQNGSEQKEILGGEQPVMTISNLS